MRAGPFILLLLLMVASPRCASAQVDKGLGWVPGTGEPKILPDAAYKRAKQALTRAHPGTWVLETLSVGAVRRKMQPSIVYSAYRLTFSSRSLERPLSESLACDVTVSLADGSVTIGQLRRH